MRSRIASGTSAIRRAKYPRYTSYQSSYVHQQPCQLQTVRAVQTNATPDTPVSYRKQLKDEKAARRAAGGNPDAKGGKTEQDLIGWELTVGLEIHAQLQTEHKLFSSMQNTLDNRNYNGVTIF